MTLIDKQKLIRFTSEILQKTGISQADADVSAELIVNADLRGVSNELDMVLDV